MFEALLHGIWIDNSLPGRSIVSIILLLLLWALGAGSRHTRRYRRENANLEKATVKLKEATTPTTTTPEAGASEEAESPAGQQHVSPADLDEIRKELDPSSLIAERLEAIEKLRTRQVRVNPNALQQLSLARDEARPGMTVPGAVASLSVMLGLLGTFIGLAVMVQQVQFVLPQSSGQVTVDSWTQSVENIGKVLGGIKTAFSASLVGIVCSILASLLNLRLRTYQAQFFERLERFTTEDLLPAAVPAVEDESLLERVSLQLQNSFSRLDAIYQLNQDALKDMTGAQRAFVDIVEEIRKITRGEASRNLEGVLEQISLANRSVLSVVEQLPRIVTAVESGQRRLQDRLASLLSNVAPVVMPSTSARSRMSWQAWLLLLVAGLVLTVVLTRN